MSPLGSRVTGIPRIENSQILLPKKLAVHIKAGQSFRAEKRHDIFAVSRGRGIGLRRLDMPLGSGHTLIGRLFPDDVARLFIQTVNAPGMLRIIVGETNASVFSFEGSCLADGGNDEDAIAPHNRA